MQPICVNGRRAALVVASALALTAAANSAYAVCKLIGGSGSQTVSFPAIDPSVAAGQVTTVASVKFSCSSGDTASWTVRGATGATANPYQLQKVGSPAVLLPYAVTVTRIVDPGKPDTLQIQASIAQINYQVADVGNYSDTLFITLLP